MCKRARHVRRRHGDDEGLVEPLAGAGPVEALVLPGLLPAALDALGTVGRLHAVILGRWLRVADFQDGL